MVTVDSAVARDSWEARVTRSGQNAWSGILFGVGLAAFVDEAVFHQL